MKSFQAQTHYEVLEVSVGASLAEIRGARERLISLYSDDQAALYGLVDPAQSAALRKRLEEAYEILADDELREIYDEEIGLPPREVKPLAKPPPPPPAPEPVVAPVISLHPANDQALAADPVVPAPAASPARVLKAPLPAGPAPEPEPLVETFALPPPPPSAPAAARVPPPSAPRPLPSAPPPAPAPEPLAPPPPSPSPPAPARAPPPSAPVPLPSAPALAPAPEVAAPSPSPPAAPRRPPPSAPAPLPSAPALAPAPIAAPPPSPPAAARVPPPSAPAPLPSAPVLAPPPGPSAPPKPARPVGGTGWGGSYAWVTPSAQPLATQPTYTYAVVPPKPVAAPPPVLVVPVPARVLAAPPPAPETPPQEPPEPRQLALDVSPGLASWGARTRELESPPPAPPPAPPSAPLEPLQEAPPVVAELAPAVAVEAAPPPPALAPLEKPVEETPAVPVLADDVQVAIVAARVPAKDHRPEPRSRPYEIPEGVEINGDLLKQVRLAKGLSLVQVSDRTRISVRHLENVEGDRYDALPAPVYLRGILMSLARELGLDGLRVSKSYLTFVEAHRSKG